MKSYGQKWHADVISNSRSSYEQSIMNREHGIFHSLRNGEKASVEIFLAYGLDVNMTRLCDGYSLLHVAVLRNNLSMVDLLLENGANPNLVSRVNLKTPLEIALKICEIKPKIIYALISNRAVYSPKEVEYYNDMRKKKFGEDAEIIELDEGDDDEEEIDYIMYVSSDESDIEDYMGGFDDVDLDIVEEVDLFGLDTCNGEQAPITDANTMR